MTHAHLGVEGWGRGEEDERGKEPDEEGGVRRRVTEEAATRPPLMCNESPHPGRGHRKDGGDGRRRKRRRGRRKGEGGCEG